MKIRPGSILLLYFNSWWLPAVCCLALLALFTITALPNSYLLGIVASATMIGLCIAFVGILAAAGWNLIKKRWANGLGNLAMLPVCAVAIFYCFGFVMFASMFGPSEDHFADNLTIPPDLVVSKPVDEIEAAPGAPEDTFQTYLLAALKTTGSGDASITADLTSLIRLQQHPDLLRRYLATSAAWRVFTEHGNVFATRRWMIDSHWQYTLHGYYTRSNIDMWSKAAIPDFQSRTTIGLTGVPWWRGNSKTTRCQAGTTVQVTLSEGNQMHESHCVVTAGNMVVEVFEQSQARERRLTKAALKYLNEELQPLANAPSWTTIQTTLPAGSIRQGTPSFELRNSFQPGLYNSEVRVNPGEPGMIYLKAFEVTRGTPLSVERLKEYSNEWVGWSKDPQQLFFSNTHFTIYEGDWGKPYAARFEVWFVPDSGAAERKLIDKVFRIEGWQR